MATVSAVSNVPAGNSAATIAACRHAAAATAVTHAHAHTATHHAAAAATATAVADAAMAFAQAAIVNLVADFGDAAQQAATAAATRSAA